MYAQSTGAASSPRANQMQIQTTKELQVAQLLLGLLTPACPCGCLHVGHQGQTVHLDLCVAEHQAESAHAHAHSPQIPCWYLWLLLHHNILTDGSNGARSSRAPPSAILAISEDAEAEEQPETSAVNLQHSQAMSYGGRHGQIQRDALQHIDEDAKFTPDVQHENSHKGKQVDEQNYQDEDDSLDANELDEDSGSKLGPTARLAAYGIETDSHLVK